MLVMNPLNHPREPLEPLCAVHSLSHSTHTLHRLATRLGPWLTGGWCCWRESSAEGQEAMAVRSPLWCAEMISPSKRGREVLTART